MTGSEPVLKIKLQIYCGEEIAMGPGKAQLLQAIDANGSISAAARAIGMSYRRAWLLVDTMNRCWQEPLVETAPGGRARAGALVTPFGRQVLEHYMALQAKAGTVERSGSWVQLQSILRDMPLTRR